MAAGSVGDPAEPVSGRKRTIVVLATAGLAIVGVIVAMIVFAAGPDAGIQIIREGNADDIREAVKLLIDAYTSLVALISAAFAVVAFLVTFQQNRGDLLTARAWGMLICAVVLLTGGLILAFIGREILLTMIAHNAVDITLPILSISRWAIYGLAAVAAALIAYFALEMAFSSRYSADLKSMSASKEG